jgi:hypothetical protein
VGEKEGSLFERGVGVRFVLWCGRKRKEKKGGGGGGFYAGEWAGEEREGAVVCVAR